VDLLGSCDNRDRQRVLRTTADRETSYCADFLTALAPAHPELVHHFTDLLADQAGNRPDLVPVVIERLERSAKEKIFWSVVSSADAQAVAELMRAVPLDDAKTLIFLSIRAGKPSLASIVDNLSNEGAGDVVRDYLLAQPLERLGTLVEGLRAAKFPSYADAVLEEVAASERGIKAIARDIAFLFGTDDIAAGTMLVHRALKDRSSPSLQSLVAELRQQNQPGSLAAAAGWIKQTNVRIGPSNVDRLLRHVGLGEYTSRKTWLQRRRQAN
jgi:hypothetical protein